MTQPRDLWDTHFSPPVYQPNPISIWDAHFPCSLSPPLLGFFLPPKNSRLAIGLSYGNR